MYAHKYTVEQFVNAGVTASIELEGVRWPMGRGASLREIFEKVCRSHDLGLSLNFATFLYFFQLQILTVFWAGLGWPIGQLVTGWSKG